jgi:hypothetical protein
MKWFKFYGQDWLTDIKIMSLSPVERLLFITLLCLASSSEEPGVIFDCDEEAVISLTHLSVDESFDARGFLKKFSAKGMLIIHENSDGCDVTLKNYVKRQENFSTSTERMRRKRERDRAINKDIQDVTGVTSHSDARIDKNREESNSREESLEALSFEEWMQDQGYTHDSIVDESGNVHEVWLQDERPVKKSQVTSLRKKYDAQFKAPVQHRTTSFDDTDRLVEIIQKVVKEQYGSSPVLTRKEKEMIRRNIVEKFDKDFVQGYARWYFQDSDLEKKWRFQIPSFTSTSFINQYLAQQD